MKKINTLIVAGSLLIAGALASPANAYDYGWNNNHHTIFGTVNRFSNRYLGQPVFNNGYYNYGNPYYGSGYYNNYNKGYYNNGYCGNNGGFVSRILNRIF